jgi:hypothetical protein
MEQESDIRHDVLPHEGDNVKSFLKEVRRHLLMNFTEDSHIVWMVDKALERGVEPILAKDAKIGAWYKFSNNSDMIVEGQAATVMIIGAAVMHDVKGNIVCICLPTQLLMPIEGPSNERCLSSERIEKA